MAEPIRLLMVDDHAVVRKGLAMVLRLEPGLEVVGEAENGRVGLEAAKSLEPDIVLVDLVMPEMDGQEMALALRKSNPRIMIMMLTGTEVDDRVYDLLAAGIEGYALKNIEPAELIRGQTGIADNRTDVGVGHVTLRLLGLQRRLEFAEFLGDAGDDHVDLPQRRDQFPGITPDPHVKILQMPGGDDDFHKVALGQLMVEEIARDANGWNHSPPGKSRQAEGNAPVG